MNLRYKEIESHLGFGFNSNIDSYCFFIYALPYGSNKDFGLGFYFWYSFEEISNDNLGIKIQK